MTTTPFEERPDGAAGPDRDRDSAAHDAQGAGDGPDIATPEGQPGAEGQDLEDLMPTSTPFRIPDPSTD